jgi:hypothetical protein
LVIYQESLHDARSTKCKIYFQTLCVSMENHHHQVFFRIIVSTQQSTYVLQHQKLQYCFSQK